MKKLKRLILPILLSLFLINSTTFSEAESIPFNGNGLFAKAKDDARFNAAVMVTQVDSTIGPGLTSILGLLYTVGLAVSVCVVGYMAIQIMIAPPEQKAQLKAGAAPYFIGLLLLVAGVPIATIIINIFTRIF